MATTEPTSPEADIAARYQAALGFARANGRPTLAEWNALPVADRALYALAGDHVARERAVMVGSAARGTQEAAAVLAPLDGGAALEEEVVCDASSR